MALSQQVAVRWTPICDAMLGYTPALSPYLGAQSVSRDLVNEDSRISAYRFRHGVDTTAVCIRRGHVGFRSLIRRGALSGAKEVVFLDSHGAESYVATRCRRVGRSERGWRLVGRQVYSHDAAQSALGMAISRPAAAPRAISSRRGLRDRVARRDR